jgi:hypothetical protein
MSELRDFIADLLERKGAAVEASEPDGLAVLAPAPVREAMGWPELARLGFGTERAPGALPIGLEGDWLDKFAALLADEGRWSEREVKPVADVPPPSDPERVLDRALDLPNAVWRFKGLSATYTRCLMLAFLYTAVSDERREGLIWLGFWALARWSATSLRVSGRSSPRCMIGSHLIGRPGSRPEPDGARRRSRPACVRCSIVRCARAWSRFFAPCAAGSSAIATGCMPITMTCATPR